MNRLLVAFGAVLVVAGLLWPWLKRMHLFHLPGDIVIDRPGRNGAINFGPPGRLDQARWVPITHELEEGPSDSGRQQTRISAGCIEWFVLGAHRPRAECYSLATRHTYLGSLAHLARWMTQC
jgi:Protein of unknown function (DUF2905)